MSYTKTELKAIDWYAKANKLRMAPSTGNSVNFQETDSRELTERDLGEIVKEYSIDRLASEREAHRLKQVNSLIDKRNIPYKEQK